MKIKLTFLTVLVYALAFVFSCTDKKQATNHEHGADEHATTDVMPADATAPHYQVNQHFQEQLAAAFSGYVALKDAFVATDAQQVKVKAEATRIALANVDMQLLTDEAHNDWMTYLSEIDLALKEIQATNDIEQQRIAFSPLSDSFYKSIKAFGLGGAVAYYEYCPMAFNNEGAYWLSNTDAVRNPYFGSKMLKCGSVQEILK
ncbi:MAG: DUF3347 domain-containing protein [Cytophagales bacterium]|nr:DUF3347 domain-containing protein [Cytophagales bacterium]